MTETPPTPYPELNTVLHDMVGRIQAALGDNFIGAYLQGSFAVGDFDAHSDVDFIVVVDRELSPAEVAALQALHGAVYDLPLAWAKHLEGSYFPREVLRQHTLAGGELWYLDHGSRSLIQSDHCNTVLVRWVVREYGVPLAGPDPASLVDPIPVDTLRREMLAVILDWGQDILADPARFENRFYQGFIVLSYCRMPHDLRNGFPGSKRAGAAWAKATLDPAWHGLIDRAWACRPDPATSVRQPADPADFQAMLSFVRLMMDDSARYAAETGLA